MLLRRDNSLMAFGDRAYKMFTEMSPEEQKGVRFFGKFKMCLFGELKLRPKIKDVQGEEIEAVTVFTAALSALKAAVLERLNEAQRYSVSNDDIQCQLAHSALRSFALMSRPRWSAQGC